MAESESDLKIFYKLYGMSRKWNGLPFFPFRFFKTLWDCFYPEKIKLIMIEIGGKIISGVIYFTFKNRVSLEYGGWDRTYAKLCPNHLLYWEAIKRAKNEGFEIFDFGRTSVFNFNLLDFKRRWGTKEVALPQFFYPAGIAEKMDRIDRSWRYRLISGICKYSPNSLQPTIGKFCYCHLG
jgi:CelD/BcsL family acetyltransferase involved in cellulose biosynthesis